MTPTAILEQAKGELRGTQWEYLADMKGHPGEIDGYLAVAEYVRRTDQLEPKAFEDGRPFRISAYANACEFLGEDPKYHRQ
ncbi:MAG: hypothetical protein EHM35_00640 [Planctomycetaceae bacterium]|nr:MAG: hypothetical protein EHM35_00640 [Planctomycetaceae bacterium]